VYIKADERIVRDFPEYSEEWGKVVDVLSEIRELIDNSTNVEKPLCIQCVESRSGSSISERRT